eukprot:358826-Chlamydomonas_euryale.AAC.4
MRAQLGVHLLNAFGVEANGRYKERAQLHVFSTLEWHGLGGAGALRHAAGLAINRVLHTSGQDLIQTPYHCYARACEFWLTISATHCGIVMRGEPSPGRLGHNL